MIERREYPHERRKKELNKLSRAELEKKLKKELPSQFKKGLTKQKMINLFMKDFWSKKENLKEDEYFKMEEGEKIQRILKKKTMVELKKFATTYKIKGRSNLRKRDLIIHILNEIMDDHVF